MIRRVLINFWQGLCVYFYFKIKSNAINDFWNKHILKINHIYIDLHALEKLSGPLFLGYQETL